MKVESTDLPEVLLITPKVFRDERGFFMESYNQQSFTEKTGITTPFVQDNHSRSSKGTLRGIHYQIQQPQGKLVRVVQGEVFDIAVDLRKESPNFGKWIGVHLSDQNQQMLWVPPGFGHGFVVTSDTAEFLYKTTDFYAPKHERCIIWNDPTLSVTWPSGLSISLSEKDKNGSFFTDADVY